MRYVHYGNDLVHAFSYSLIAETLVNQKGRDIGRIVLTNFA